MKYIFLIVSTINLFFVIGLIFYFALVFLNVTFTSDDLKVSDVPYYDADLGSGTTRRYFYHWWEFASDGLRILEPILMTTVICTQILWGPHSVLPFVVIMTFMVVMDTAKLIKRAADWVRCGDYQFCRNFDTSIPADRANYVFVTCFFFNLVYWILAIIYLALLPVIQKSRESNPNKVYVNGGVANRHNNKENEQQMLERLKHQLKRKFSRGNKRKRDRKGDGDDDELNNLKLLIEH